jgi:hypothetical protein
VAQAMHDSWEETAVRLAYGWETSHYILNAESKYARG